jgi:hypothetical protein
MCHHFKTKDTNIIARNMLFIKVEWRRSTLTADFESTVSDDEVLWPTVFFNASQMMLKLRHFDAVRFSLVSRIRMIKEFQVSIDEDF